MAKGQRQHPAPSYDLFPEERDCHGYEPYHRSHASRRKDDFGRSNNLHERKPQPPDLPRVDSQRYNSTHSKPMQNPPRCDKAFISKSKLLKEYLVHSLNAALKQIDQWYPDPSDDAMDWQHEQEIVLPPPTNPLYSWDRPSDGGRQPEPNTSGGDSPRQGPAMSGLKMDNIGGGKQWSLREDCTQCFFTTERRTTPDLYHRQTWSMEPSEEETCF